MDRLVAQLLYDRGNVVVLEEADGGDARGPSLEAGVGVLKRDSAQSQNWDSCLACFPEKRQTGSPRALFLKYWTEDGEGCSLRFSLRHFCWRVAGDRDDRTSW